jgi:16S rRNA (guanine1207-N2)-methyltransferase
MSDTALHLLLEQLAHSRGQTVWVADEQIEASAISRLRPRPGLMAVSNRCDVAHVLQGRGFMTLLSDFSFEPWAEKSLDVVAYRISKEKAIVHHVINAAVQRLHPGAELWLVGGKNEGIKTYLEKAARYANGTLRSERHGAITFGIITRGETLGEALDDQSYRELRELQFDSALKVWSKPGIYGWQKIDRGSALLVRELNRVWPDAETPPKTLLDLGCGYGYLSLSAAGHWPDIAITATDNNIAAVHACEKNLASFAIRAEVLLTDCANGIDKKFDAVLCNPPFHQGFEVEGDLTTRFLETARNRLAKNGRALFVVNQFIPLERKAAMLFRNVREVCREQGFKVIALEP